MADTYLISYTQGSPLRIVCLAFDPEENPFSFEVKTYTPPEERRRRRPQDRPQVVSRPIDSGPTQPLPVEGIFDILSEED